MNMPHNLTAQMFPRRGDQYVSEGKKEYFLDSGYTVGNLVILGDCQSAWRISKQVLADASPVFRDMFASKLNNSGNEIKISDVNSDDLKTFLDVITAKRLSSSDRNVPRAQKVIPLLLRFDMVHLAKPFLYQCVLNLSPNYIYEAFVLASQLDDLDSGLRILTQGHVWYHGTGKHSAPSLCPGSVKRPWTRGDADQVRSGWMWALSHATENVDTRRATTAGIEPDKPAYWLLVAGEFVGYIHR